MKCKVSPWIIILGPSMFFGLLLLSIAGWGFYQVADAMNQVKQPRQYKLSTVTLTPHQQREATKQLEERKKRNHQIEQRLNRAKIALGKVAPPEEEYSDELKDRWIPSRRINQGVTMRSYKFIYVRMTYEDVCKTIGKPGVERSVTDDWRTVQWTDGWKSITIIFRRDRVYSKWHSGLT